MKNKRDKNIEYEITKDIKNKIKFLIDKKELISYTELCKKLNWKVADGNTKKKQIKILEQEFEFEYIGEHSHKKFLFTGIKEKNILTKPLTNKGDYTIIDVIIMEKLNTKVLQGKTLEGSRIKVSTELQIINKNLSLTLSNIEKVAILLGYDTRFLNDFVEKTTKKIRNILDRSLERLEENGYITTAIKPYVKFIGVKYPCPQGNETSQKIMKAEDETLKKLGYNSYKEVKDNKKVFIYNKLLNEELKKYKIDYIYDHYIINKKSKKNENITINTKNIIQINQNIVRNFTATYKNIENNNYYLLNKFLIDNLIDIKSKLNIKDMLSELENEDEE